MKILEIYEIENLTKLQYNELNYSVIENQRKNINQNHHQEEINLAFDHFYIPLYDGVEVVEINFDDDEIEIEI